MRIGLACAAFPGAEATPERTLELARSAGFGAVQFLTPHAISPTLDVSALRAARDEGTALGLDVEIGVSHFRLAGDRAAPDVERRLDACVAAGWREISAFTKLNRFDASEPMERQLDRLVRALDRLAPSLREVGAHVNIETHEDVTSFEVLRVVERVGSDVVGITLDVANLAVSAEDPVAAAQRLAPHVRQTHLGDVTLHFVPRGVRRTVCEIGAGVVDWHGVLGILIAESPTTNFCIEIHRGQYDAEIFCDGWIARHPDLSVEELAAFVARTVDCTERQSGPVVDRSAWPVPLGDQGPETRQAAIAAGATHLRSVLTRLAAEGSACRDDEQVERHERDHADA